MWRLIAGVMLLVAGCYTGAPSASAVDDDAGEDGDEPATGDEPSLVELDDTALLRLSVTELDHLLLDVTGLVVHVQDHGIIDSPDGVFAVGAAMSELQAERVMAMAEAVGGQFAASPAAEEICGQGQSGCFDGFMEHYGAPLLRHHVDPEVRALLQEQFSAVSSTLPPAEAAGWVLTALLQSPDFLYHWETRAWPDGPTATERYVVRLAFLLWRSGPDAALVEAARGGEPATAELARELASTMIDDPRFHRFAEDFFSQWLSLGYLDNKSLQPIGEVSKDELLASLFDFIAPVLAASDGTLAQLLRDDIPLTGYPSLGPYHERDDQAYWGILAHPAVQAGLAYATETNPIKRGEFVREHVLCMELPPPPPGIPPLVELDLDATRRERFEQHTAAPACSGCHLLIDPIGFGFEEYDAFGRHRTHDEHGNPIDSTGELTSAGEADGPFDGVAELVVRLGTSSRVRECFAATTRRFAIDPTFEYDDARLAPLDTASTFEDDGMLRKLLLDLATEPPMWSP